MLNLNLFQVDPLIWRALWTGALGVFVFLPLVKYRKEIHRRLQRVEDDFSKPLMIRRRNVMGSNVMGGGGSREVRCLELNPEFVAQHQQDHQWKLVSLGEYLTSLHVKLPGEEEDDDNGKKDKFREFIEREIEASIATVLLRTLGRHFGGAILPLLGISNVNSRTGQIATNLASWWVSHFMVHTDHIDLEALHDAGAFPFNLDEMVALANLNQKFLSSKMEIKSLEWFRRGEVGYEPSFGRPLEDNNHRDDKKKLPELIPNPFVVSDHWDKAIEVMEWLMEQSTGSYDPDSRDFPEPTPINERLLPDLRLGWGNAKCTHTKREVLRNRLLCVLLNKLAYNFYKKEQKETDLFIVNMGGKVIRFPHEFLQALIEAGHQVEMCPRSTLTSFGLAVCIQESDGSYSNVPMGIFLRSGYENSDLRSAHYALPHGGMDLQVTGPLVSGSIQFYMAIEGMCGWHSNHNANVPWIQHTASTEIYTNEQAILAAKLAGILAVTFNALGTEMDLPYGGYGVLGVCNDTAALLDYGVRLETDMFPLVSTGRFMIRSSRRLIQLYNHIKDDNDCSVGDDVRRLITACCKIQSDLQASPNNLINSSERFLASQPEVLCFQIEQESKAIMTYLKEVYEQFDDGLFHVRHSKFL